MKPLTSNNTRKLNRHKPKKIPLKFARKCTENAFEAMQLNTQPQKKCKLAGVGFASFSAFFGYAIKIALNFGFIALLYDFWAKKMGKNFYRG